MGLSLWSGILLVAKRSATAQCLWGSLLRRPPSSSHSSLENPATLKDHNNTAFDLKSIFKYLINFFPVNFNFRGCRGRFKTLARGCAASKSALLLVLFQKSTLLFYLKLSRGGYAHSQEFCLQQNGLRPPQCLWGSLLQRPPSSSRSSLENPATLKDPSNTALDLKSIFMYLINFFPVNFNFRGCRGRF